MCAYHVMSAVTVWVVVSLQVVVSCDHVLPVVIAELDCTADIAIRCAGAGHVSACIVSVMGVCECVVWECGRCVCLCLSVCARVRVPGTTATATGVITTTKSANRKKEEYHDEEWLKSTLLLHHSRRLALQSVRRALRHRDSFVRIERDPGGGALY